LQGILNEQYATLEGLTNDDNQYFAERIVNMYLAGLPKHMIAIEQALLVSFHTPVFISIRPNYLFILFIFLCSSNLALPYK
jgi:hypothetical protein